MFSIEDELHQIFRPGARESKRPKLSSEIHPVVRNMFKRGFHFAREPFELAKRKGIPCSSISTQVIECAVAMNRLLSTSYDLKYPVFDSPECDLFKTCGVSKAMFSVFMRKGWSTYVWRPELVEFSSFRACIGMAMMIYGLYIQRSMREGSIDLALSQCADAYGLLLLHLEKKTTVKYRQAKEALSMAPTQLARKGAAARKERLDPVRQFALQLANAGSYRSRRQAVLAIKDRVVSHARSLLNISMSEQQAEKTIDGWLKDLGYTPSSGKQGMSASKDTTSSS
ncbi:hypothetical protein [Burkholderia vietnamiensis]|uniref:hypothetical protein n=1 Tax=Burkholderia vietnamiensis TaxID=60552 RepID=UPI000AB98E47|nr:hypothetical protein [Burkholderia vietnamiensis]HDR9236404.1 hypothetical protein [Burkholderia vietnamiensis]